MPLRRCLHCRQVRGKGELDRLEERQGEHDEDDEDAQVHPGVGRNSVDARRAYGRCDDAAESDVKGDDAQRVAGRESHELPLVAVGLFDETGQRDGDEREDAGGDEGEQARTEGGEEEQGKPPRPQFWGGRTRSRGRGRD